MPVLLPLVGIAVLLINLLAAGGIGSPGVSGTLWLLLALGLNAAEEGGVRTAPQKTALALLATAVLLAVACYLSAYGPVLNARWRIERATEDPPQAKSLLLAAAAADPLAAEPWNLLAGMQLLSWERHPTAEAFADFERYQREFLRRKPNSAAAAAAAAERYFLAFEQSKQERPLEGAVDLYRKAVDLYPNNATYRAKLALTLMASGDQAGFQREAARALELDALTPHADKKLPGKLRSVLQRSTIPGE
jgi:tetratricopeptide (TPR) repeat protein